MITPSTNLVILLFILTEKLFIFQFHQFFTTITNDTFICVKHVICVNNENIVLIVTTEEYATDSDENLEKNKLLEKTCGISYI